MGGKFTEQNDVEFESDEGICDSKSERFFISELNFTINRSPGGYSNP